MSIIQRASLAFAGLLAAALLAGCSFSSGGGGGSAPGKTYIVMPNGQAVPAEQTSRPPPGY